MGGRLDYLQESVIEDGTLSYTTEGIVLSPAHWPRSIAVALPNSPKTWAQRYTKPRPLRAGGRLRGRRRLAEDAAAPTPLAHNEGRPPAVRKRWQRGHLLRARFVVRLLIAVDGKYCCLGDPVEHGGRWSATRRGQPGCHAGNLGVHRLEGAYGCVGTCGVLRPG